MSVMGSTIIARMEFEENQILRVDDNDDTFTDINIETETLVADSTAECKKSDNVDDEIVVLNEIRKNIWSCDLIICLFFAALKSYRKDRCLRPFPNLYISKEDGKDFNALRNTCDSIPPLEKLIDEPKQCSKDVMQLLHLLFVEKGYPALKRIGFNSVPLPSKFDKITKPHYVFEVDYQRKVQDLWEKRIGGRDVILAYHGSSIDNFYSILKVGLQQHFSVGKEVLYGNGIYLSNEVSISAHYSQFGPTWQNSNLGRKLSVLAICEIINDVDKVKCKDSTNKQRSLNKGGLGEIPDKYFVVTDNDMVRIKYLMVYREKNSYSSRYFVAKNFFFIILGLYLLLIIAVGIFNNPTFIRAIRWFNAPK